LINCWNYIIKDKVRRLYLIRRAKPRVFNGRRKLTKKKHLWDT